MARVNSTTDAAQAVIRVITRWPNEANMTLSSLYYMHNGHVRTIGECRIHALYNSSLLNVLQVPSQAFGASEKRKGDS